MREKIIYALGVTGTVADYVTSRIGLTHPRITEMNPLANPILEGIFAVVGSVIVFQAGKTLKANRRLVSALATIPACIPVLAAVRNVIIIMLA